MQHNDSITKFNVDFFFFINRHFFIDYRLYFIDNDAMESIKLSERDKKFIERRQLMRKLRALMFEKDIRIKEVAERAGVSNAAVSKALAGHFTSRRIIETIEKMIARAETVS